MFEGTRVTFLGPLVCVLCEECLIVRCKACSLNGKTKVQGDESLVKVVELFNASAPDT